MWECGNVKTCEGGNVVFSFEVRAQATSEMSPLPRFRPAVAGRRRAQIDRGEGSGLRLSGGG